MELSTFFENYSMNYNPLDSLREKLNSRNDLRELH